ncbi:MAG: UDP-4-amino-4,6-dideoxy-N-acetyl-beta-L-altrosamine transaminase [Solirubrobacteraceae bacterium]
MASFLPYGRQSIDRADIDAVIAALRDPFITQGPRVKEFERGVADHVQARHAIAFANGTAALHAAASAAGLRPGDEVLTTPISFVASANCALFVGARPVFADIDPVTANLDLAAARASGALERVRACVVVSLAGLPADLAPVKDARERGMVVIEDAAHALGAERAGRPVGAGLADMTAFSLHPVKAITSGEGGLVATDSDELAEALDRFRSHGIVRGEPADDPMLGGWHYGVESLGLNYRITDIQCALGLSQLQRLDRFILARNAIAESYHELLSRLPGISLPARARPGDRHAYHLFVVRFSEGPRRRRLVYDMLREAGIGAQVHYIPIPAHALYRDLGYDMDGLPQAQAYWEQALSLPMFPAMERRDVERVAQALQSALEAPLGVSE